MKENGTGCFAKAMRNNTNVPGSTMAIGMFMASGLQAEVLNTGCLHLLGTTASPWRWRHADEADSLLKDSRGTLVTKPL